jgi:hypothetical protein
VSTVDVASAEIAALRERILALLKAARIGPGHDTCVALMSLSAMCLGEDPQPHDVAEFVRLAGLMASDGRARVEVLQVGPMEPGGEDN